MRRDYITELDSCCREEEELMVSRFADGYMNCEGGAREWANTLTRMR